MVKRMFLTIACATRSLMVVRPRGRFLPLGLGMKTRFVGSALVGSDLSRQVSLAGQEC